MSWVLLTDAFAYKLKEPVRYDYLDFSTPAARIARVAERRFIPSAARLWVRRYPSEEWPCVDVVW